MGLVGPEPYFYLTPTFSYLIGYSRKEELYGQAYPCEVKGACSFSFLKYFLQIRTNYAAK